MNLALSLGLLGLIATIAGVYIGIKYRYFLGQVTFLKEQTIALFDTIVKNLPELSIIYNGKPVSPNLVLIKGALLNSGKKDISPSMVENPITIKLAQEYKWIEAKVISTSENVKANITSLDQHTIAVETGLFRSGEFIRLEALIEVPTGEASQNKLSRRLIEKKIEEAIHFSHRIADLRKINKSEIKEGRTKFKLSIKEALFPIIFLPIFGILIFIFFGILYYLGEIPRDVIYSYKNSKNEIIDVKIFPKKNNQLEIKGVDKKYNEITSIDKFYSNINKMYIKQQPFIDWPIIVMCGIYFILPLLFITISYLKFRKNRKLRMILNI